MKKRLPIGISDYKELREENYYYVDKTLLIRDIKESGKAVLVARPRRFGKTLNLSMLRYFYEISENHNDLLFSDTEIWKLPEYRTVQGSLPVIFVSFREIIQNNFDDMLSKFATVIAWEFKRHAYILEGDALDDDDKDLFNAISRRSASKVDLGGAIEFLMRLLNKYHKKKVLVLLDEYDVPVQTAYIKGFYDPVIEFVKELLTGAFKDQEVLEKGVITGNLTLAKAGLFSGLNNLDVYNITQPQMADKFGFTAAEIDALLTYYELEEKRKDICEWFDGYAFGGIQGIFNPWSVLMCIKNGGDSDTYWSNTSDNLLLKKIIGAASPTTKMDLEQLFRGEPVIKRIEGSIVFPDLSEKSDLFWSLLLYSGYITYTHFRVKDDKKEWFLVIPNKEVKQMLADLIKDIFHASILGEQAQLLLKALVQGDVSSFSRLLQSFIQKNMSAFDITNDEPEKSYHLFVLGILLMLEGDYEVKSNGESGLGRYDIMIIPKNIHVPGIIIEFKKVWSDSKETPETVAQKALDQILLKNYKQELTNRGVHTIIAYGIAFERRTVSVKCMRLESGKELPCNLES